MIKPSLKQVDVMTGYLNKELSLVKKLLAHQLNVAEADIKDLRHVGFSTGKTHASFSLALAKQPAYHFNVNLKLFDFSNLKENNMIRLSEEDTKLINQTNSKFVVMGHIKRLFNITVLESDIERVVVSKTYVLVSFSRNSMRFRSSFSLLKHQ